MKKFISFFMAALIALPLIGQGRINIPDLPGLVTLKADFHMHTVFSDGTVWPTVRIDEAVREGLDVISITDHLEFRPYVQSIETLSGIPLSGLSHNIAYEIAKPYANERGIILIRGSEITRAMPPGHFNAIFLTDCDALANKDDYMDAMRAARAQNAFIFWNHPSWTSQQPDTTLWFPEHTMLLQQGFLHGIEVANGSMYCPESHRWCLEKNLTMIGTSDAHAPVAPFAAGRHRTMTLVFARSRTEEAIHEALRERRTAVLFENHIIGDERNLKALFESAVEISVTKTNETTAQITLRNKSDLTFHLRRAGHDPRLTYFRNNTIVPYTIRPQSVQAITVRLNEGIRGGDVNFIVENFLVEPEKGMRYTVRIE